MARAILGVGIAALLALFPSLGHPVEGETGPDASAPATRGGWLRSARLLDGPAGPRGRLESSGVAFQGFYNQFLGWRARGGTQRGDGWGTNATYDFFTQLDLEELADRPGLQALAQVKGGYDDSINHEVGALSDPIDDADFDEGIYLSQLFIQQGLWRDRAVLRIGFLEQQNLFDRNAVANSEDRQFSAAFLDNNPVVPLPNSLGVVLWVRPAPWLELAAGVSDADNKPRNSGFHTAFDDVDSLTALVEATFRVALSGSTLPGSYRVGMFRDGSERSVFGPVAPSSGRPQQRRGHYGMYLSFDQALYRTKAEEDQGLTIFGRMGLADEEVSPIDWFGSLGLAYRGLVPGRREDVLGLGAYYAASSDSLSKARAGSFQSESAVELYYQFPTLPWLVMTSHLQYLLSHSGEHSVKDAVVALLRLRVSL